MGITGLLPMVKKSVKSKHIRHYANQRIAIDGHAWIHTVLPSVAYEIYYGTPTNRHLDLFMNKINSLVEFGIRPILVFDGDSMISKQKTNQARKEAREKARKQVEELLSRNETHKAREIMKRCVSITPEIFNPLIQMLRIKNIEFIISPYEADAQLVYLQRIGYVDHIMTEDSDLILYNATKVLYKFNGSTVEEYDSKHLHECKDHFFKDNILDICILSGCDYLDSIKGIGLITAHKRLLETGSVDKFVDHMIALNKPVPLDYKELFKTAKLSFLHHIVYNPLEEARCYFNHSEFHYEFLGTLDHLPYKSGNISLFRHFKPKVIDLKEEQENLLSEFEFGIEKCPYFE